MLGGGATPVHAASTSSVHNFRGSRRRLVLEPVFDATIQRPYLAAGKLTGGGGEIGRRLSLRDDVYLGVDPTLLKKFGDCPGPSFRERQIVLGIATTIAM